jgi:uncharacterized repeat protein (TIGR02543 family)
MKQLFLSFFMLLAVASGYAQVASGTTGDCTWTLSETGTLTISGTGAMPNYELLSGSDSPWYPYRENITAVVVESGVENIGNWAFYNYGSLVSVSLSETVTSMHEAFAGCSSLTGIAVASNNPTYSSENGVLFDKNKTTIFQYPIGKADNNYTIPASVTYISFWAFFECSNLITVILPESLTSIGNEAFFGCSSLESITLPEEVTYIGDRAFMGCRSLKSIIIPEGVTSIGDRAFGGISGLIEIIVASNNLSYSSEDGVLFDKNKTAIIQYPMEKAGNIYTIPASVVSIGHGAFWACSSLESIILPASATSIEMAAFAGCRSLESIVIPESVTSIGAEAFDGCSSLESIVIPESVIFIGDVAFRYCHLTEITVAPDNPVYSSEDGVLFDKNKAILIQYPTAKTDHSYIFPASVTSIANHAFVNCHSLTEITVNWTTAPPAINSNVFSGLTLVNIALRVPDGTKAIYETAEVWQEFNIVEQSNPSCPSGTFGEGNALAWEFCNDTLTISGTGAMPDYNGSDNTPPWYSYREDITSVVVESGVTSIGAYAFYYCSNFTSTTLPESVNSIGAYAFAQCHNLTSITIPEAVTSIGNNAFIVCSSLTGITVASNNPSYSSEDGVLFDKDRTAIIQYPLGKAGNSYTVPAPVTSIENYAFYSCNNLVSVTLPESVNSIGTYAFAYCSRLASMTVPAATSIGDRSFVGCSGLESIILPASVSSIGTYAFLYCRNLADITVNWTTSPLAINSDVFYELTLPDITLHVPSGTEALYRAAGVWKEFNIVSAYMLTVTADRGTVTGGGLYNTGSSATVSAVPNTGYRFVNWTVDGTPVSSDNPFTFELTGDTVLHANFEAISCNIVYNLDGGVNHSGNPATYTVESPLIILQAPAREGYDFADWSPGNTVAAGSTGDKTFIAQWSIVSYSISYVLDGGVNHSDNPATYTIVDAVTLQSPTRTGYEFAGWTEGAEITAGSTGDKTFTAEWSTVSYIITYELDGGLNHADNPAGYTVTDAVTLQSPTRTGYDFAGWAEGAEIAVGSTGDKTFTAQWSLIPYSITYELDGGVNHPDNPATYRVIDEIRLQSPTRSGYGFTGWAEGNSIAVGSTGEKTFTAQWECVEANIEEIAINGVEISESLANDDVFEYIVGECGESSISLDLEASSQANVTVNSKPYAPEMGIALEGDLTSVNIRIESESGDNIKNYTLKIAAPLNSSLYYQRWDDVIAVNRNPATNGGYNVSEIRWYKHGTSIGAGEFIQLQNTESANDYYAEVNIVETGAWHRVCATAETRSLDKIIAYPNPVPRGETLTLKLPEQYAGSVLNIYDIKGALVRSGQPLPAMVNSVDMSEFVSGVYLLRISDKQGKNETIKIIVE